MKGVEWAKGVLGSALSFDGKGGYVSLGVSGMPQANAAKTIAWAQYVATQPSGTATILSLSDEPGGIQLAADYRGGRITISKWGGSPLVSADPAPAGEWHFYAYTYDGKTNKLFVDGVPKDTSTTPPQTGPFKALELGRWRTGVQYFGGMLDEMRIYTRALSDSEVQALVVTK